MSPSTTAPRRHRVPSLLLVVLVALAMVSGCARVRVALAVQPDDTVTGEIVVATPQRGPDDPGPTIALPPELASEVDVSEYRQDGYTGSVLRFSGLSFAQVAALGQAIGPDDAVRFTMHRAGTRVAATGSVDLTTVTVDQANFRLKISFPGEVLETNADDADAGTVSWTFTPGEVGDVSTVVAFDDPNAPSAMNWTIGLAGVIVLVSAVVVLVARRTRNPPLSPPTR